MTFNPKRSSSTALGLTPSGSKSVSFGSSSPSSHWIKLDPDQDGRETDGTVPPQERHPPPPPPADRQDLSVVVLVRPKKSVYYAGERFECTIEFKSTIDHHPEPHHDHHPSFHPVHRSIPFNSNHYDHQHPASLQPTNNLTSNLKNSANLTPDSSTFSTISSSFPSTRRPSNASQSDQSSVHPPFKSPFLDPPAENSPRRRGLIGPSVTSPSSSTPPSTNSDIHHHLRSYLIHDLTTKPPPSNPSFSFSIHEPSRPSNSSSSPSVTPNLFPRSFEPFQPSSLQFNLAPQSSTSLSTRKLSTPTSNSIHSPSIYNQPLSPRRASLQVVGSSAPPHRTIFVNRPPRSSFLGWSYCQFEGYLELPDKHIDLIHFESLHHPQTRGGGKLVEEDLDHLNQSRPKPTWMGWLFGSNTQGGRSSNHLYSSSSSSHSNPSNRFPVFQNPISLLDVDVRLEAGQSCSYSFSMDLPINLPPTYRGKLIKFNYELIIGTNVLLDPCIPIGPRREGPFNQALSADPLKTSFPGSSRYRGHKSRTFRIPIKIFNHVYLNGSKPYYDLLKPIISSRDTAKIKRLSSQTVHDQLTPKTTKIGDVSFTTHTDGLAGLERYGLELLKGSTTRKVGPGRTVTRNPDDQIEELQDGCITAVEIITRSAPKVSFDINKDGKLVAQLSVAKSIYRLGETIEGTIEMNGSQPKKESGKVIKSGISLESIEELDPRIVKEPDGEKRRIKRKIYSEQEELVIDTSRSKFCLVIPSDGSPDFETSFFKLRWRLKLRLQFIPIDDPPEAPPTVSPTCARHQFIHHQQNLNQPNYHDCHIQEPKKNQHYHHQRIGSSITDRSHQLTQLYDEVFHPGHLRSKSIPSELNSRHHKPTSSSGGHPVYHHLIPHSIQQGIFKPIPEFGLIPIEFNINSPIDVHHRSFSPKFQRETEAPSSRSDNSTDLGFANGGQLVRAKGDLTYEGQYEHDDDDDEIQMKKKKEDQRIPYPLLRSTSASSSITKPIRGWEAGGVGRGVGLETKRHNNKAVSLGLPEESDNLHRHLHRHRHQDLSSTNHELIPIQVEFLECFIPIQILPGNTPFKPVDHTFII